jgi:hypothetical protein
MYCVVESQRLKSAIYQLAWKQMLSQGTPIAADGECIMVSEIVKGWRFHLPQSPQITLILHPANQGKPALSIGS